MKNEDFATAIGKHEMNNKDMKQKMRDVKWMMMRGLGAAFFILHSSFFISCSSDWRDGIAPSTGTGGTGGDAVTFSTVVSASRQATRASKTIINRGETTLRPTASDNGRQVGIFGCYTGQYHWEQLQKLAVAMSDEALSDEALSDEEYTALHALADFSGFADKNALQLAAPGILNKYYSANQMYNVPATVQADGSLTYTPQQFWPNNPLTNDATQHEYMTFWAYYPWNATSTMGKYGISITDETTGLGMGMGKVKFTMNPDASQHNDFLISAPVMDCNRDKYALERTSNTPTYAPKPVQFTLYHMLAQVRMYAYIVGKDKMVYTGDADATWFDNWAVDGTIMDEWGNVYTKKGDNQVEQTTRKKELSDADITKYDCGDLTKEKFLALGLKVPDESQCVRWERKDVWDLNHTRRRADITYSMEFNNIHTTAEFYPRYYGGGVVGISYDPPTTLGSTTVNHYIMNPYWFTFKDGKRERLNDNYMFDYFEDTPVAKHLNATTTMTGYDDVDGWDWTGYDGYDDVNGWDWTGTSDPLAYLRGKSDSELSELSESSESSKPSKHYNFAPGNIILVVPQTLRDDDVPHVVITAKDNTDPTKTARVTINLLKMGISWESGYIYCYAFLDDLRPGDDKVRGPESVTVHFNTNWYTDQW